MDQILRHSISNLLTKQLGKSSRIASFDSIAGGCINSAFRVELADGHQLFLKVSSDSREGLFDSETVGLKLLGDAGAMRVPDVIGSGTTSSQQFLILEWIDSGTRSSDFSETMGRQLALLHRTSHNQFGLDHDNVLGSTLQPNSWSNDWGSFWAQHRLGFQLDLAQKNRIGSRQLFELGDKLVSRLGDRFTFPNEPPALIHGDLWSGNYLCDSLGMPVLIDPAVYFASREAEFGMTTLFGGFDDRFYDAYKEAWPLPDGSLERIEIYRLYHLLNHLNLFGESYLPGCLEIIRRYT